jgi:2-deoxy-D-gluconate 3-dehydrogenase
MTLPGTEAFSLAGRRAIVTGGGGDIGGGLTEALAEAGATVAIVGRSENLSETAAQLGSGGRVHAVRGDLGSRDDLVRIFDEALGKLGGLDIFVACHGSVKPGDSIDYDLADWDATLESNLSSVFRLCQLAGERMIPQGRGKIITIASMLSFSGGLRAAAYAASKGGVAQLTKALANEWAPKGINVNAIAPGYVQTSMNRHIWQDPVRNQQILARLPAGRWGTSADLKGAVLFLASSASDYVHGIVLPVDGGFLAR